MNKSMVDAFSAKQVLIQDKKLLPDLRTYKIALGYGKREQLNSFMAKIDLEILPAREAWSQITGVKYSPEIVFAIAGLVPRILGVKSIIASMLQGGETETDYSDDSKFRELFYKNFDPIDLDDKAQAEITTINSVLSDRNNKNN